MKKSIVLIPCLMILAACQPPMTREQELAIYHSRCFEYGFQPGTVEFDRCMQEQEAREDMLSIQSRQIQAIEHQNSLEWQKVRIKQDKYDLKRKKHKEEKNKK